MQLRSMGAFDLVFFSSLVDGHLHVSPPETGPFSRDKEQTRMRLGLRTVPVTGFPSDTPWEE